METDYCQRILLDLNQHYVTDIYILGLPGEVLVEIGLEIKNKAGIENLFVISLANDAVGYVCPPRLTKREDMSIGAEQILSKAPARFITKQALNIINRMKRSR